MVTREEIEEKKKKLDEVIEKEFFAHRSEWDIKGLLREKKYCDIKIILSGQIVCQSIQPEWLIKRIEKGATIEQVLEYAKEAQAKIGRIYELIGMCTSVQRLDGE